uniref:Uncharacterized protein n=1 Tax=Anguilla anguilla TaxID=7936 RepID=A0A0E9PSW8_ANGAN
MSCETNVISISLSSSSIADVVNEDNQYNPPFSRCAACFERYTPCLWSQIYPPSLATPSCAHLAKSDV